MTEITEDYVSFETAKLLQEKGFNKDVDSRFSPHFAYNKEGKFSGPSWDTEYNAPTLQIAMKWLREVHKCYITFTWEFKEYDKNYKPIYKDIVWFFNIAIVKYNSARKGDGDYFDLDSDKEYNSYEQACEGAIKYCLENLI